LAIIQTTMVLTSKLQSGKIKHRQSTISHFNVMIESCDYREKGVMSNFMPLCLITFNTEHNYSIINHMVCSSIY